jgi:hypothetical protein
VLRDRRGELRDERADRGLVADEFRERCGPQRRRRGTRRPTLLDRLDIAEARLRGGRFRAALVAQRLDAQVAQIVEMPLRHLLGDLALDRLIDAALREQIGESVRDLLERRVVGRARRRFLAGRVFENKPLQTEESVRNGLRSHQGQRAEFPRAQHHLIGAERSREDIVERRNATSDVVVCGPRRAPRERRH